MSRRMVDVLRQSEERHRYLRGLRTWAGFRQVGIPVERAQRHSGKSKYSLRKLLMLAGDGIFSFSVVPLRAATVLGAHGHAWHPRCIAVYSLFAKFVLQRSPTGFTALYIFDGLLRGRPVGVSGCHRRIRRQNLRRGEATAFVHRRPCLERATPRKSRK